MWSSFSAAVTTRLLAFYQCWVAPSYLVPNKNYNYEAFNISAVSIPQKRKRKSLTTVKAEVYKQLKGEERAVISQAITGGHGKLSPTTQTFAKMSVDGHVSGCSS